MNSTEPTAAQQRIAHLETELKAYQDAYFDLLDRLAGWGLNAHDARPSRKFITHWLSVYQAEDVIAAERQREEARLYLARSQSADPKRMAQKAVNDAVALGHLPRIKTRTCADCGQPARHYHHDSYEPERWLNVIPLCRRCHFDRHTNQKEEAPR